MKRLSIGLAAVLAMLIAASSAFAAIDTYSAGYSFTGEAGSKSKPAPLSFTQRFTLKSDTAGSLTGIISSIKTEIRGVKVDATGFEACSATHVNNWKGTSYANVCPKTSLVAKGAIKAQLGTAASWTPQGLACDPDLYVWNAGGGKLTFFFETTSTARCLDGNIVTGQTPAFTATYKQSGNDLIVTIPVPNSVTNPGSGPYFAAVTGETLRWTSTTSGAHRDITSVGCSGKRHFSYTFSAHTPSGQRETKTLRGEAPCG